jgi:hypothetical protein
MKRERDPTPEEFEKFLSWLDPDPDAAGRRLQPIQSRLIQIFTSRGCVDADSLADEVLNRVAVRIDTVIVNYSDPLRCCVGFVSNVFREYLREQEQKEKALPPPEPRPSEELEREDRCLKQCLGELTEADQGLFVRYFQGEKRARIDGRKKLAVDLSLTGNALRIQAFRLRQRLSQCMTECLGEV